MNYILNPDGSFMSADEIVADLLLKDFGDESVEIILNDFKAPADADQHERIAYAFSYSSFGRWIRNSYGLWNNTNPHVLIDAFPNDQGIIDHPLHPDNFSGMVMDRFIEAFKIKHSDPTFTL